MNSNRRVDLLRITVATVITISAVAIVAIVVPWSLGLTSASALPHPLQPSQTPSPPPQPQQESPKQQAQTQGNVTVIYNKGLIQALQGNYSGALSLYNKALGIDMYDTYSLDGIGRTLVDLHNYTGAIKYFDKSLAIDPSNSLALNGKGFYV